MKVGPNWMKIGNLWNSGDIKRSLAADITNRRNLEPWGVTASVRALGESQIPLGESHIVLKSIGSKSYHLGSHS